MELSLLWYNGGRERRIACSLEALDVERTCVCVCVGVEFSKPWIVECKVQYGKRKGAKKKEKQQSNKKKWHGSTENYRKYPPPKKK